MAAKRKSAVILDKLTKLKEEKEKKKTKLDKDTKEEKEETFFEKHGFTEEINADAFFEKNLPPLLPNVDNELESQVKTKLNIDKNATVIKNRNLSPVLDSLSCELRKSVTSNTKLPFVWRKKKSLTKNNDQSQVTLFDVDGPVLATNLKTAAI